MFQPSLRDWASLRTKVKETLVDTLGTTVLEPGSIPGASTKILIVE